MRLASPAGLCLLLLLAVAVRGDYTTPCLSGNFSATTCGDCEHAEYGVKPAEFLGLMWARCTKCRFYVPNEQILTDSRQLQNLGKYGCTWVSPKFLWAHPGILLLCLMLVVFLALLLYHLFSHHAKHSIYRRHQANLRDQDKSLRENQL